jgi:(p)ppGpp synthase/HD superfamily hydrolase
VVLACDSDSERSLAATIATRLVAFSLSRTSPTKGADMTWKFHLQATAQRRLFSRILQILENQMVSIHSFTGETSGEEVRVTFLCSSEQDKAYRIEALLHRLEDVRSVAVLIE